MQSPNIELTAVFVADPKKGFTAFFAQLPNILAEGNTEEEASRNLFDTFKKVFEYQKIKEIEGGDRCMNTHVTTKNFNLSQ